LAATVDARVKGFRLSLECKKPAKGVGPVKIFAAVKGSAASPKILRFPLTITKELFDEIHIPEGS
jgi:hypothetical protein